MYLFVYCYIIAVLEIVARNFIDVKKWLNDIVFWEVAASTHMSSLCLPHFNQSIVAKFTASATFHPMLKPACCAPSHIASHTSHVTRHTSRITCVICLRERDDESARRVERARDFHPGCNQGRGVDHGAVWEGGGGWRSEGEWVREGEGVGGGVAYVRRYRRFLSELNSSGTLSANTFSN